MEEIIKKKINQAEDYLCDLASDLQDAKDELYDIYDLIEENSKNSIKDIDNFKRELKREGLCSEKLEEFIEEYMKYYNK